jgi:hypothetical protein
MTELGAHTHPLNVQVIDGEIVLTGDSGPTGLSMTPQAALETSQRLAAAAREALDQPSQALPPVE